MLEISVILDGLNDRGYTEIKSFDDIRGRAIITLTGSD
jgi:hypothetical protein